MCMKQPFVIGITGGSGSGKTCIVRDLKEAMGEKVTILSQDDYYIPREQQVYDEKGIQNFDLPTSINLQAFVVDMKKHEIKAFDSLHQSCNEYLNVFLRYLEAEHMDKKGSVLPSDWCVTDTAVDIPRQGNDDDCGVFVSMFAYYLSLGFAITNCGSLVVIALLRRTVGRE